LPQDGAPPLELIAVKGGVLEEVLFGNIVVETDVEAGHRFRQSRPKSLKESHQVFFRPLRGHVPIDAGTRGFDEILQIDSR